MSNATPYRVLITGSRTWTDIRTIGHAIEQAILDSPRQPLLIINGACPEGADQQADRYARWLQGRGCAIDIERHPANWRPNGVLDRSAGFRRNAEMVNLGADLCLAFIRDCSRGATHTADLAEKAGITVRRFTA